MKTLTALGREKFTDKTTIGYLDIYEKLWKNLQHEPIKLLEIGVYNGNSMRTWCEWFSQAEIVGVDLNAQPHSNEHCGKVWYGNQTDPNFLQTIVDAYKEFDIIIDDGGHIWWEQQYTFEFLYPFVKSGGMYIIEDLGTSMDEFWSHGSAINTIDYLKNRLQEIILDTAASIEHMEAYKQMVVIFKK